MKYKFAISIILVTGIFFVSETNAQVIVSGVVTNANTGELLPGATVKIEGSSKGFFTDSAGKYTNNIKRITIVNRTYATY